MAVYQVQFIMPYFSNVPEDVITNVWHFSFAVGNPSTAQFNSLRDALMFFYNDTYNQSTPMLAPWVNAAGCKVKIYNLSDPTPRAPVYQSAAALSAANQPPTSGFPPELAICLSFQGALVSGLPQARRRGRIFIGGIAYLAAGDSSHFPNIDSTIRTDICANAVVLGTDATAAGFVWSVWSRTDQSAIAVTNGWVDNAADTQRRRGNRATARTLFP